MEETFENEKDQVSPIRRYRMNLGDFRHRCMMKLKVYVVVKFLFQVIFVFLLFFGMVMYANEVETKEKLKLPRIKN